MIKKALGKIESIYFGYQDMMFGVSISLVSPDGDSSDFKGFWNTEIGENTEWTDTDRQKAFADVMDEIRGWLSQAKVKRLDQLKNIPVEIVWEDRRLKSWRILQEVL